MTSDLETTNTIASDKQQEWLNRGKNVFMNTYASYPVVIKEGKGARVEDINGKTYLDFVSGIAVNSLGHRDDGYVAAITTQLNQFSHCSNLYLHVPGIKLAEELIRNGKFDRAFFCNSGTEAIEAAIKLSRKYAKKHKGDQCTTILTMSNSFHGRTYGALSATAQTKYHKGYHPLVPDFETVTFNDIDSVKSVDPNKVAAIILEPIQGEGGIHVVDASFLQAVRDYCTKENIVLIFDEIQCGVGRTGHFFAHQHFGTVPDLIALAKGLGGGFPIGALLAGESFAAAFEPGDHGSTFGGNALACAAAFECVSRIGQPEFLDSVRKRSERLREGLKKLQKEKSGIVAIRGLGLMVGVELEFPGKTIIQSCMDNGLLIVGAGEKVLRLLPPLTVTDEEVDQAIEILSRVLKSHKETTKA
ncbi:MAG: aspartate aminotransferase family protein [Candidatus Melainabacteria bacterium]|nr:MAG: aspartate aminotransferase family protein [Candidatus Melainabacteria bacterium]